MKSSRTQRLMVAIAALSMVAGLTACTSNNDNSGGNVTKGNTAKSALQCGMHNGKKATGDPIKIRAITTASGGVDFSSSPVSAKAYFDCVNANGGINGRPVDYQYQDDALNPTKTQQIAAQFASDDSIVALAGDSTFAGCSIANAEYVKGGLYSITGVGVDVGCFDSSNIAPVNAGPRRSTLGPLPYLKEKGLAKRVVFVGTQTTGNADWVQDGVKAWANANGVDLVGSVLHPPGVTDATSVVLAIKKLNPTAVIESDPGPDTATILKAAQAQGMGLPGVQWASAASAYDSTFPPQVGSYWNGFISDSELQLFDATGPDNELWKSVMDAYAPKGAVRDTFSQAGFLSAKILTSALLTLPKDGITRASVSKAMLAIKDYKTDLLCAPWYYGDASAHSANHATRLAIIKDGKYVELRGCQESGDPALDSLIATEKSQGLAG